MTTHNNPIILGVFSLVFLAIVCSGAAAEENITIIINQTDYNYTLSNESDCYNVSSSSNYNITINETVTNKTIKLLVTICYDNDIIYCGSSSVYPTILFVLNRTTYDCSMDGCNNVEVVSNPYNASHLNFSETITFVCFGKNIQDSQRLWLVNSMNVFDEKPSINYYDFSNSTFIDTHTYNITYNSINNVSDDVLKNITTNISNIEARVSALESWRIEITGVINNLINIISVINALFTNGNICYSDGTNCPAWMNETNSTNITIPPVINITNITIPIVNLTNITVPIVNLTNITIPPINDTTNITVPIVNLTNITIPPVINITNITVPIVNLINITIPPINNSINITVPPITEPIETATVVCTPRPYPYKAICVKVAV